MPEEKSGDQGFKVIDRRTFSADGTRREDAPGEAERKAESPLRLAADKPRQPAPDEYDEESQVAFETLVSYLSTTAMFQMGLLASPTGERIPADLVNARRTIDLLDVLQQKTRGNLTPDEERLLEEVLYELRMSFVEVEKRWAKKGK